MISTVSGISFGTLLRDARKAARLTQLELGDAIGVSDSQVSKWEHGASTPSPESLQDLVRALSGHLDEIKAWKAIGYDPPIALSERDRQWLAIFRAFREEPHAQAHLLRMTQLQAQGIREALREEGPARLIPAEDRQEERE